MIIAHRYILLYQINKGEYGKIYNGEKLRTKEKVAIKMESNNEQYNLLKHETKVYQYLKELDCVPTLKWFGIQEKVQYLVMPLYDYSLSKYLEDKRYMGTNNIYDIAKRLLTIIKSVHDKGIIHRDIKPENFMIDVSNDKIMLIDFGFAKRYLHENGTHKEFNSERNIVGTPNYISINIHNGDEPSRRDDVESVCYILYFIYMGINKWTIDKSLNIVEQKIKCRLDERCPSSFRKIFNCCSETSYKEEPRYSIITQSLQTVIL